MRQQCLRKTGSGTAPFQLSILAQSLLMRALVWMPSMSWIELREPAHSQWPSPVLPRVEGPHHSAPRRDRGRYSLPQSATLHRAHELRIVDSLPWQRAPTWIDSVVAQRSKTSTNSSGAACTTGANSALVWKGHAWWLQRGLEDRSLWSVQSRYNDSRGQFCTGRISDGKPALDVPDCIQLNMARLRL